MRQFAALARPLESLFVMGVAGLLWVLAAAPIVTVGPATSGLFSVMSDWDTEPPPVWRTFWTGFGRHFRQSLGISVLVGGISAVVAVDLNFALHTDSSAVRIATVLAALVLGLIASGPIVFAFPLLARHASPWRRTLRNAVLFGGSYVGTTVLGVVVLMAAVVAAISAPAALPLIAAGTSYLLTRLTGRAFTRFLVQRKSLQRVAA